MNERHDDLQEIIDAALREMAAEGGRRVRPACMQPRGVLQEDGAHPLPGEDDQGPRVQGPAPREQREEGCAVRARRAHRPVGRPPAKGRHQLAGEIRAAARPGLRRRPHHGEDLHRGAPGVDNPEALDAGLGDGEVLLEFDVSHAAKLQSTVFCLRAPRRPTAPGRGSGLQWPPWPGATRTRSLRTSRWWP